MLREIDGKHMNYTNETDIRRRPMVGFRIRLSGMTITTAYISTFLTFWSTKTARFQGTRRFTAVVRFFNVTSQNWEFALYSGRFELGTIMESF